MEVEDSHSDRENNENEAGDQSEEKIPTFTNMDNFTNEAFTIIKESIKSAGELPLSNYDFFDLKKPFRNIMTNESNRLLSMMNNIIRMYGVRGNFKTSSSEFKADLLVETNDVILEKVADSIDEINGIKKCSMLNPVVDQKSINGSWNRVKKASFSNNSSSKQSVDNATSVLKLLSVTNIKKPQEHFSDKIDNSNDSPWEPRIKEKPNSLKPLAIFLEETERGEEYSHPYEFELEKFSVPEAQLTLEEPVSPKLLEETKLVEVDTEEKLKELVEDLRKYSVIAIDLEHHSYRTFMGITCLMQISTEDTDYIIDTISLRNSLYVLNEIFTKPSVLKIFHGADSDILWLQRDLSLYIVNMFDTYHAARVLSYSSLSLASLLERFCNFSPNKHFQMADWRLRPLPDALKKYAREDTHYLIYIYKVMKQELLKKSGNDKLLSVVFERSLEVCKKRFFKHRCTETSYLDFYESCKRMFDKRQLYALKNLYNWRDQIARDEDESLGYVLPNHMLLQIAETLPKEMQGILACCNPIPQLVRSNLLELHQMILKARDIPTDQPILQEDSRARGTLIETREIDLNNPLSTPFDLSKKNTNMESVPVLLEDEKYDILNFLETEESLEKSGPIYSIVNKEKFPVEKPLKTFRSLIPFERYNCVKILLENEEKSKDEQIQKSNDVKPVIPEIIELEEDAEKIHENLSSLTDDNKTEEERLESLNNHFQLLSHKTQEDVETEKRLEERLYQKASSMITERAKNLTIVEESRKRKREDSEEEESDMDEEPEHKFLTPVPVKSENNRRRIKNNKRQSSPTRQGKNNRTTVNVQGNRRKRKSEESSHISTPKRNKYNSSHKNREQNQSTIEPFDYASVDFRQFQGGAGEVNKGKTFGCKFKSKRVPQRSNRGKRQ